MAHVGGRRWRGPGPAAAVALACTGTVALALGLVGAACGQGFSASGDDGGSDAGAEGATGDGPAPETAPPPDAPYDGPRADASCLDCSDPACKGVSCASVPAGGWTLVAAAFGANPGECPPVYGPATDMAVAGGPPTCGCDCDGGVVSCGGPPAIVAFGTNPMCNTGAVMVSTNPGCNPLDASLPLNGYVQIAPIPAQTTACTASPTKTLPPEGKVRICPVDGSGGGCDNGKKCVPIASPFMLCIEQPGDASCPLNYPTKSSLGTMIDDKRSCSSCTCSPLGGASCAGETLTGFTGANCNGNSTSVSADGTCYVVGGSGAPTLTYDWTASPKGGGCMSSGSMPVGGETIGGQSTLCCP